MFTKFFYVFSFLCLVSSLSFAQNPKSTQLAKQKAAVFPSSPIDEKIKLIEGKAVLIYDGDTISIEGKDRKIYSVRLQGIDAPEEKQDYFKKSRNKLGDLILGRDLRVVVHKKDSLGTFIGSVYLDGQDIGLRQILSGMAWHFKAYSYEQTAEDRKIYAQAELQARSERTGLWGEKDPTPPWDFRGDKNPVEPPNSPPAGTSSKDGRTYILGPRGGCYYINESGAKVYVRNKTLCGQ